MLLMLGENNASNRSSPIGTEEEKVAIASEKEAVAPTMPKPETRAEDSSLATS